MTYNLSLIMTSLQKERPQTLSEWLFLYFPGQRKCKAFPFRSSKKYLVPEREKLRSFLDIAAPNRPVRRKAFGQEPLRVTAT